MHRLRLDGVMDGLGNNPGLANSRTIDHFDNNMSMHSIIPDLSQEAITNAYGQPQQNKLPL